MIETGDYISRDELVDTLDECIEKCEEALPLTPAQVHEMKGEVNATKAIRVFVKRFPAADVRPVAKAHFSIVDGYSVTALGYDIKGLECSNCGATYIAQTWVQKFNFCPNCGCAMEVDK